MDVLEGSSILVLLVSNLVAILLVVFFWRDRYQQRHIYKHQLARLEMKALIAQMNPHFMFNTLNGIQSTMILKGEEEANKYIGIFSTLLRKTLDMSALQSVSLAEEISYLKSYIALQELCLNYPVKTSFEIAEELDVEECKIPTLIMQPLIENVIIHGISSLKKPGKLKIKFSQEKDSLSIVVLDNGVGTKKAKRNKELVQTEDKNTSSASKILQDRIDIYNDIQKTNSEFKLEDRIHKGKVIGTKATLIIPKLIDIKSE